MSLANSWKNYFTALPDEDERHRQLADIRGILSHGLSPDEAVAAVKNDPNSAVLYLAQDGNAKLLFQCRSFAGSWLDQNQNTVFVAHSGAGTLAGVYEVDHVALFQDVNMPTPTAANLRNTATAQELLALNAPAQNPTAFQGKRCIVLPPFLVKAFFEAEDRSPAALLAHFQRAITSFDNANEDAVVTNIDSSCNYMAVSSLFILSVYYGTFDSIGQELEADRAHQIPWDDLLIIRLSQHRLKPSS